MKSGSSSKLINILQKGLQPNSAHLTAISGLVAKQQPSQAFLAHFPDSTRVQLAKLKSQSCCPLIDLRRLNNKSLLAFISQNKPVASAAYNFNEVQLGIEAGLLAKDMLFASPFKPFGETKLAAEHGVVSMAATTVEEVLKVKQACPWAKVHWEVQIPELGFTEELSIGSKQSFRILADLNHRCDGLTLKAHTSVPLSQVLLALNQLSASGRVLGHSFTTAALLGHFSASQLSKLPQRPNLSVDCTYSLFESSCYLVAKVIGKRSIDGKEHIFVDFDCENRNVLAEPEGGQVWGRWRGEWIAMGLKVQKRVEVGDWISVQGFTGMRKGVVRSIVEEVEQMGQGH